MATDPKLAAFLAQRNQQVAAVAAVPSVVVPAQQAIQQAVQIAVDPRCMPPNLLRQINIYRDAQGRPLMVLGEGTPVPRESECAHFAYFGTTGTGKTMAILRNMYSAWLRNDACLVLDCNADIQRFMYSPERGDVIFNPSDARCVGWSLFNEIRSRTDYMRIASLLIPEPRGSSADPFWTNAARVFVANIIEALDKQGHTTHRPEYLTNRAFYAAVCTASVEQLQELLAGSQSARWVKDSTMFDSIRATASARVAAFEYLDDGDFSVTEWVRNTDKAGEGGKSRPWVWLAYSPSEYETFKNVYTLMVDMLQQEVLRLKPSRERRLHVILDEITSIGKMGYIVDFAKLARKYGCCLHIGFQSVSLIEHLYGRPQTIGILSNINNQLMLRVADGESGKFLSEMAGKVEVLESSSTRGESSSASNVGYDNASFSEGSSSSTTTSRKEKDAILASVFMHLQNLTGFARSAGNKLQRADGLEVDIKFVHIAVMDFGQDVHDQLIPADIMTIPWRAA